MTVLKDISETGSSDEFEDNSRAYLGTHSTEHLPASQETSTRLPPGSSHTKIQFIAPQENTSSSWETTRHRSPPPQYHTEGGGWTNDIGPNLPTDYEPWAGDGDLTMLEERSNEDMWWNPRARAALKPLGAGLLPVLAASKIHDETHELIKVSVSAPDYSNVERDPAHKSPTLNDLHYAIPHPDAYYCPKCNGWVVVKKVRTVNPPIYQQYRADCPELNFPGNRNGQKDWECNKSQEEYHRNPEQVHHYHLYEDAIPGNELSPELIRKPFEPDPPLPRKICTHHVGAAENFWRAPTQLMMELDPDAPHPGIAKVDYLDLYACCLCMTNIMVTRQPITGVVSPRLLADLQRERASQGESLVRVPVALEFIHRIVEGLLWGAKVRPLKYEGTSFIKSFGEDAQALQIWEELGYTIDRENKLLVPPDLTDGLARSRLLRAWVELGAYTADYLRKNPSSVTLRQKQSISVHTLCVRVHSATDELAEMIGSHPNQIPRGLIEAPQSSFDPIFHGLGLTQSSYTPKLLSFAYKMQAKCDVTHLPIHVGELDDLVNRILPQLKRDETLVTEEVRDLLVMERSRDRWTPAEYDEAVNMLDLGPDSSLLMPILECDPTFFENAYKLQLRDTWKPPETTPSTWSDDVKSKMEPSERRQKLKIAMRISAEGTGMEEFYEVYKKINQPWAVMDPEKAYTTLSVPADTTDEMLLMVYNLRVQDSPASLDRMKEALYVLAEARNSSRLREFLNTGNDPGEARIVIFPDWPRGLNQLGNTCYLNSLLQYFYTIRDLRQVILSMKSDGRLEIIGKDKLSDAQLQKHRVGGRLVTRKEIERSRQFLAQLSNLFSDMAWADSNAVTPSLELAKLALVTSKDEEEDEAKANPSSVAGTNSSASTDATLVEEGSAVPGPLPANSATTTATGSATPSSTVLGKRPREADMDVDETVEGPHYSKPRSPRRADSPPPDKTMRINEPSGADEDVDMEDVEISSVNVSAGGSVGGSRADSPTPSGQQTIADTSTNNQPPPLPKRQPPPLPPRKQPVSDSVMMFGKQHDVAECMDNCMFQIETALLDFEGQVIAESDKTSIVKRLFYGKIRQRISPLLDESTSQGKAAVNVKEDLFSHLPVNVSDEGIDLYDGLAGYFQDNVEFESKKATMEVSLLDLPQILQIQLQRVQFNRQTLQPYKSQAYVKFWESLYMDRWLEDANPEKKARSKEIQSRLAACRDRINTLTVEHGVPMIDALKSTAVYIQTNAVSPLLGAEENTIQLSRLLARESSRIEEELKSLRSEVVVLKQELEGLWADEQMAEYELTSVFIHRGSSPSWGHYFFYARNLPDKPDEWFKYNDSSVTKATKEEVLADTTGSTANPYLLVFARKGSGVMHTVNRLM